MTADVSHIFENARVAARKLNLVDTETIDKILLAVADEAEKEVDYILQENCRDLALMPKIDPKYDRLMLSRERILGITSDMRKVAGLPSPLGRILASFDRPNGMRIENNYRITAQGAENILRYPEEIEYFIIQEDAL